MSRHLLCDGRSRRTPAEAHPYGLRQSVVDESGPRVLDTSGPLERVELALRIDLDPAWIRQVTGGPVVPGFVVEASRSAAVTFVAPLAEAVERSRAAAEKPRDVATCGG
ncbi:hypothetical protein [Streptomyces sp. NPDC001678]|uniref:hypothetical protein n=1 Tax=Streptomyces sp. NPDC001678 TaxID=3364599 RepID=UPI0036A88137